MKIYRAAVEIYDVEINEDTVLNKKLMSIDVIKSTFSSNVKLDLRTNDYIVFNGIHYRINQLPVVTKSSTRGFDYDATFEGYQYSMIESNFMNQGRPDFSLYTNIDTMMIAVRDNLNRKGDYAWTFVNNSTVTDFKNIAFNADNCLSALNKIVGEFLVEWYLSGTQIIIADKVGNPTGLTFEYKVGLKNIIRSNANKNNLITQLSVFGGIDNISSSYRNGLGRLGLSAALENNVSVYGKKEGTIIYDDIYPKRTGIITSATDRVFVDTGMDFDLNSYLLPGVAAKIIFKSGHLAGYMFDLHSYDNLTKTFTILPYKDPAGFTLPNVSQIIQAGDTYTLVDIIMPTAYETAAEAELLAKGTEEIALTSVPRVTYKILTDWRYFKTNEITVDVGDSVTIHDTDLSSSDITTRIIELSQVVISPYKYIITVADDVTYGIAETVVQEQRKINNIIKIAGIQDAMRARAGWMNTQELRNAIFDPDDYFNMENIRPGSIETLILTVGAKSQQFILKDVTLQPNYDDVNTNLNISTGSLVHLTIDPANIVTWIIGSYTTSALNPANGYYIYVRASRTLNTADWLVTTDQHKADEGSTYYYFLVGYLHLPSTNGMRNISLTYGSTTITGEFITTGRITSADGQTYFDLESGEIGGKIRFQSGHYDNEIEQQIAALSSVHVFTEEPVTPYYKGSLWTNSGSMWICITDRLTGAFNIADWMDGTAEAAEALLIANMKGRTFFTTPTTPYKLGDLWATGNNLYRCIVERLTGVYNAADWDLATYYDRTQTTIDGGIITTGRIEVGGGVLGSGNAGINGAISANPNEDIRFWSGATYSNRATAPFRIQNDGKIISTYGQIGGWNLASDAIYSGTKSIVNGINPNPGITLSSDGSIHAPTFFINSNGEAGFSALRNINMIPVTTGYFRGSVNVAGNDIWENTIDDNTTGTIRINFYGYQGGSTRDRSLIIGCGRGRSVVVINGVNSEGRTPGISIAEGVMQLARYSTAITRNAAIPYPYPGMMIFQQDEDQFMGYTSTGWYRFTMH